MLRMDHPAPLRGFESRTMSLRFRRHRHQRRVARTWFDVGDPKVLRVGSDERIRDAVVEAPSRIVANGDLSHNVERCVLTPSNRVGYPLPTCVDNGKPIGSPTEVSTFRHFDRCVRQVLSSLEEAIRSEKNGHYSQDGREAKKPGANPPAS